MHFFFELLATETLHKNRTTKVLFYRPLSIHKSSTRYPQSFKIVQKPRFDF
jgi:hypothetical protein